MLLSWNGLKLFLELTRAFEKPSRASTQWAFISRTSPGPKFQLQCSSVTRYNDTAKVQGATRCKVQCSQKVQTTQTVKIHICCLFKENRLAETCNTYDEMKIKHLSVEKQSVMSLPHRVKESLIEWNITQGVDYTNSPKTKACMCFILQNQHMLF